MLAHLSSKKNNSEDFKVFFSYSSIWHIAVVLLLLVMLGSHQCWASECSLILIFNSIVTIELAKVKTAWSIMCILFPTTWKKRRNYFGILPRASFPVAVNVLYHDVLQWNLSSWIKQWSSTMYKMRQIHMGYAFWFLFLLLSEMSILKSTMVQPRSAIYGCCYLCQCSFTRTFRTSFVRQNRRQKQQGWG